MNETRHEPIYQGIPAGAARTGRGLYGLRPGWWVVICLLYIVSPIDLAPELVFGPLGIIDDAGIAAFGIYNFVRWLKARRSGLAPTPRSPRAS